MPNADDALTYVEKHLHIKLGRGTEPAMQLERFSTGLMSLDWVIGGGLPLGRIIEIYGQPSFGKTSVVLEMVRQFQGHNYPVVFADLEHALDPDLAAIHGVDMNQVLFPEVSDTKDVLWGEDLFLMIFNLARTWTHTLFVIDSVAALLSKTMVDAKDPDNMLGKAPATQARLLSQSLRLLSGSGVLQRNKNTLVLINQLRTNVGGYGPIMTRTGGKALDYYSSLTLEVRRGDLYEDPKTKEQNGHEMVIRVEKNKTGHAYKTIAIPLMYETGFDLVSDVFGMGLRFGVIERRGSWFYWGEHKALGQDQFLALFENEPALWDELSAAVRQAVHEDVTREQEVLV